MQFTMTRHGGLDPISGTWLRGLIATAIEWQIRGLCWHVHTTETGTVATGYVTATFMHEAAEIRRTWADYLGLTAAFDDHGRPKGYFGNSGPLEIHLPDAVDPDDRCLTCEEPFDPRDTRPNGYARYQGGETCRSCATTGNDGADGS